MSGRRSFPRVGAQLIEHCALFMPDVYMMRPGCEMTGRKLPGQFIMSLTSEMRHSLSELKSSDLKNISDWWIKIVCGA